MPETDLTREKPDKDPLPVLPPDANTRLEQGFMLGSWQIQPMAGRFEKDGARRHVEPKVMDVLLCLARNKGNVVSRDKLFSEVWSGLVVSDEVLTRAISELRTLLNDTSRERRYIRTVPKRGYALIAEVVAPLTGSARHEKTNGSISESGTDKPFLETSTQHQTEVSANTAHTQNANTDKTKKIGLASRKAIILLGILTLLFLVTVILANVYEFSIGKNPVDTEFEEHSNGQKTLGLSAQDDKNKRNAPEPPAPPVPDSLPSEEIPTLAIMPFINLSSNANSNFFSEGLSEDIRSALIAVPGLKVVARTSSEVFKNKAMDVRDIGIQLGVRSLLEGTVRIYDQNARITLQITNTESGFPFWSDTYDYKIDDIFAIQKEIAEAVVKQLSPQLLPELPTLKKANPKAHQYYLLGRHFWHQRTVKSVALALENLKKGLAIDPNYSRLHAALSDTYIFSSLYGELSKKEAADLAQTSVDRALELDPDLPEAYASRGLLYEIRGEFKRALKEYKRAVELNPTNTMARMWYGNALSMAEDVNGAHEQYQKALEHDPLHPVIQQNFLGNLLAMGRAQETADMAKAMHEISEEERLLKPMLIALSKMGKFDTVLEFLVRYNFSDEYQDHSILMVAEMLINLHRFEQAKFLLADQKYKSVFEGKSAVSAKLAVAERDPVALNALVETLNNQIVGEDEKHKLSEQCIMSRKFAWRGLADFMNGTYNSALKHFLASEREEYLDCDFGEDRGISLLLYIAETQRLLGDIKSSQTYFDIAKKRIDTALELGWGKTYLQSALLAYYMLTDQIGEMAKLLELLKREKIEPWSGLINNPILDQHLNSPENQTLLAPLEKSYQVIREKSRKIPLAKYGIE